MAGVSNTQLGTTQQPTSSRRFSRSKAFLGIVGFLFTLAVLIVAIPNCIQFFGQQSNLRTIDQLVEEMGESAQGSPAQGATGSANGQSAHQSFDCILVLGAAVRPDGTPSPMLQERLDTGIELYNLGIAPKIIMSGDNQSDRETYNEVNNMKAYAVAAGVPSEDIFCDHAGICTYDSAYRAYHVFGVTRAVVVSQKYHLYRALFDMESFGIRAIGVPADRVEYSVKQFYYLREAAARVSDTLKVMSRQNATYLSEPVSLNQSGDVTSWEY